MGEKLLNKIMGLVEGLSNEDYGLLAGRLLEEIDVSLPVFESFWEQLTTVNRQELAFRIQQQEEEENETDC